ncbi:MAG: hypothetical protein IT376_14690 [Polyangiaceae bacterium]|nr:hypothetical protein [Polyangiaceae bacterium]
MTIALAGLVAFMLTALVVGARLLALWRRTRELPELLLGAALITVGFLCYAVGTAAKLLVVVSEDARAALTIAGLALEGLGQLPLVAFSWRVFHPRSRVAAATAVTLAAAIVAAFAAEVETGQYLRYSDALPASGPWIPLGLAARGAAPAWMALECFRLHAQLRRRLTVGLAEPLVVHRVALWGAGIGASALAYATSVGHRVVYGTGLREHVWAVSVVSMLALVSAVCLGIAYFPPEGYRRWAEGRTRSG